MAHATSHPVSTSKPSFGQALAKLPSQYVDVLTRPTLNNLEAQKTQGRWSVVWFQLIFLAIVSALITFLAYTIAPLDVSSTARTSGMSVQDLQQIATITSAIVILIATPITFLLSGGVLYLIARLFGGKGTYLEQLSVTLLFGVPLALLSTLLVLPPATRAWLPWVPHIYSAVLMILTLIAVHRRSTLRSLP